eukprot:scaffold3617_cov119-Isochrysis_galbana.AAC.2
MASSRQKFKMRDARAAQTLDTLAEEERRKARRRRQAEAGPGEGNRGKQGGAQLLNAPSLPLPPRCMPPARHPPPTPITASQR